MPSDKRNSIMAVATSLISSLLNVASSLPCLFSDHCSSNACIMVQPKLTFVLFCAPFLSPLPHRWQSVICVLLLQCEKRLCVSAMLEGVFLMLFFAWTVRWKWSAVIQWSDQVIHPLFKSISEVQTIEHFLFTWIDFREAFKYPFIMLCDGLKWVNTNCAGY